jgi:prohibitin 1
MLKFMKAVTVTSIVAGGSFFSMCFIVRPGEGAVVYNRLSGIRDHVYSEGLQFRMLGIEEPKIFNIRLRARELSTSTGTKDLQVVNVRLRVLFHPDGDKLATIYRELGMDYDERVLPSVSNEVLKAVIADYNAEALIGDRETVSDHLTRELKARAKDFNLIIEDASLVHIQFGQEFMAAVEQKQVAQQDAERFKYIVLENEQRKKAAVIRAEGEAMSARMISDAIAKNGNGLLELRKIEAARDIAVDVAAAANVSFVPGGSSMLLNVPGGRRA